MSEWASTSLLWHIEMKHRGAQMSWLGRNSLEHTAKVGWDQKQTPVPPQSENTPVFHALTWHLNSWQSAGFWLGYTHSPLPFTSPTANAWMVTDWLFLKKITSNDVHKSLCLLAVTICQGLLYMIPWSHLVLTIALGSRYCYDPHFTAKRDPGRHLPRTPIQQGADPGCESGSSFIPKFMWQALPPSDPQV